MLWDMHLCLCVFDVRADYESSILMVLLLIMQENDEESGVSSQSEAIIPLSTGIVRKNDKENNLAPSKWNSSESQLGPDHGVATSYAPPNVPKVQCMYYCIAYFIGSVYRSCGAM